MNPGNCVFLVMLYTVSQNDTVLACYIFNIHQPVLIIFVDNKVALLSTVCKYYFSPSHFAFLFTEFDHRNDENLKISHNSPLDT